MKRNYISPALHVFHIDTRSCILQGSGPEIAGEVSENGSASASEVNNGDFSIEAKEESAWGSGW